MFHRRSAVLDLATRIRRPATSSLPFVAAVLLGLSAG